MSKPNINVQRESTMLVDLKEAARRLCLSERTVWQLQADGLLPSVRIGRSLRFRVSDLSQFVEDINK